MDLCIDSCVVIDLMGLQEPGHAVAVELFQVLAARGDIAHVAQTTKWELLAVWNHPQAGPPEGSADQSIRQFFKLVPIDDRLNIKLFHNIRLPMKGADMIILACARHLDAPLITRDRRLLKWSAHYSVVSMTPQQYIDMAPRLTA